jgi:hypothetical protein
MPLSVHMGTPALSARTVRDHSLQATHARTCCEEHVSGQGGVDRHRSTTAWCVEVAGCQRGAGAAPSSGLRQLDGGVGAGHSERWGR